MRNFIIVGHRALTSPNFSLNDLPGTGGRMDILARSVNSAFLLSHDIRREVEVVLVLHGPDNPTKTIRFNGAELKYLNPDERSTGALIRNALMKFKSIKSNVNNETDSSESQTSRTPQTPLPKTGFQPETSASPGIFISNTNFEEIITHYEARSKIVFLNETGSDLFASDIIKEKGDLTFVLSDDKDFTAQEEELLRKIAKFELCLSPNILHTEHCIILVHNILDRFKTD
jgi:tRNA (pseudouridine54-N1)-methyltransferase